MPELSACASGLHRALHALKSQLCAKDGSRPAHGTADFTRFWLYEGVSAWTVGIREQCRKARYLYLKASLLEGLNLEINQDKETITQYVSSLKLSADLAKSLNEAERLYRSGGDEFTMKASMGLLRSFMETLQGEALARLQAKLGGAPPDKWGAGLSYLREYGVISQPEEQYAVALYKLISDTAVHPLMAEREYARLARNVVIEYALLFLRNVEKRLALP